MSLWDLLTDGTGQVLTPAQLDNASTYYKNYDSNYNTLLSPREHIAMEMSKSVSPFARDSGYDYDYAGFYKKYGNFTPQATNGHLTDEYKKPYLHNTFSTYSNYYDGSQGNAINWNNQPYKFVGNMGWL